MNSTKIILAATAGLGAGIAIGILIAPDKGSETFKKMSDRSNEYLNEIKAELREIRKIVNKNRTNHIKSKIAEED